MVEDYAYLRTDFRGGLGLPLPEGAQWGELRKKILSFSFFFNILFFVVVVLRLYVLIHRYWTIDTSWVFSH